MQSSQRILVYWTIYGLLRLYQGYLRVICRLHRVSLVFVVLGRVRVYRNRFRVMEGLVESQVKDQMEDEAEIGCAD